MENQFDELLEEYQKNYTAFCENVLKFVYEYEDKGYIVERRKLDNNRGFTLTLINDDFYLDVECTIQKAIVSEKISDTEDGKGLYSFTIPIHTHFKNEYGLEEYDEITKAIVKDFERFTGHSSSLLN